MNDEPSALEIPSIVPVATIRNITIAQFPIRLVIPMRGFDYSHSHAGKQIGANGINGCSHSWRCNAFTTGG